MAVVIHSDELGVFLGECMGLGFWSKLDAVDQDSAVAFSSPAAAQEFMSSGDWPADATFIEVDVEEHGYATMEACIRAGIAPWLTTESATANHVPI